MVGGFSRGVRPEEADAPRDGGRVGVGRGTGCARGRRGATDFVSVSVEQRDDSFVRASTSYVTMVSKNIVRSLVQTNVAFCSCVG